ncbi:tyrosine-type recombinase/integrase [Rhodococcus fascians]|nr:tyrosine-type recombinase/integrase [Rhodococcus fascians]MBY4237791.1 tyrosine-type recombinase/integrase [Rhodococcus fascians]MBY4253994.1 tyrosine-type recombinase/integrase [Rhodococcus fascians]MBY4269135.1 tyrosine-type recombinase/integrase [Rhodococcus fascians]
MTLLNATLNTPAQLTSMCGADRALYAESFVQRWDGNTRISYRGDLKIFFDWCDVNGIDVFTAHRMHLELFVRHLTEVRGNSPSTIKHRVGTVKLFYEIALDDDLVRKNPCRLVRLPRVTVDHSAERGMSERDFERLVHAAAVSSPTDYALVLALGVCGLRVSSACSLDVETSTVVVQAHRMFVFTQKGGDRVLVPQPPMVIQAVDRVIGDRVSGPLFLRRDGSRMSRRSADRVVKRVARAAGIERVPSPHALRHHFCVASLDANVPLETVARSMGHKDSSTTYRHYSRRSLPPNQHSSYTVAGQMLVPVLA